MTDTVVHSGKVPIAVRDHGGTGPPVLLVHGAGGHLLGWRDFPRRLTGAHRVVSLDLRGHGHSGDGDWTADAVLSDLEAVADHFGFRDPAIVGHSLGGMLAAMWTRRHPDGPGVSIDGHRSAATRPANYAGIPAAQLEADLTALTAGFDAEVAVMSGPLPAQLLESMRRNARTLDPDEPQAVLDARLRRNLVERDGRTFMRPDAEVLHAMRVMDEFVDAVPVVKQLTGRFLMLLSTRDSPGLPPQFADLMAAHRAGLRRDLADVPSNVTVADIDASHDAIREAPGEVAGRVLGFLTGPTP